MKIDGSSVIVMSAVAILLMTLSIQSGQPETIQIRPNHLASYTSHAPITILSDSAFIEQGWPGSGVASNPYIISGLMIDAHDNYGIWICNTTASFEIRNCYVKDALGPELRNITCGKIIACSFDNCGMTLGECRNCSIIDSAVVRISAEGGMAIGVWKCEDCILSGNVIGDNSRGMNGISVQASRNITVHNNHIFNLEYGLHVGGCMNCSVERNTIFGNGVGFLAGVDSGLSILNNTIHDNVNGLVIDNLTQSLVINNTFTNDGVLFQYWSNGWWHPKEQDIRFADNTVNGKQIGYFFGRTGFDINTEGFGQLIFINCSQVTAINPSVSSTNVGIHMGYCEECSIEGGLIHHNSFAGVELRFSKGISIQSNVISFNKGEAGILLTDSEQNIIANNIVQNNTIGIRIVESGQNSIRNNTVLYNTICGVRLVGSYQNEIFGNSIGGNGENAYDNGNNRWDNGIDQGNRWSDYDGSGSYAIGPRGAHDDFPSFLPGPWPDPTAASSVILAVAVISLIAITCTVVLLIIKRKGVPRDW